MKFTRTKSIAAAIGALASIGAGSVLSATSAHADGARKPVCTFIVGSGTAHDDISRLKCVQNDNAGFAYWLYGATSLEFYGTEIAGHDSSTVNGDKWYFDPSVVNFSDIKKELQREYGYTNVTYGGHEDGTTGDVINANYDVPSKTKH